MGISTNWRKCTKNIIVINCKNRHWRKGRLDPPVPVPHWLRVALGKVESMALWGDRKLPWAWRKSSSRKTEMLVMEIGSCQCVWELSMWLQVNSGRVEAIWGKGNSAVSLQRRSVLIIEFNENCWRKTVCMENNDHYVRKVHRLKTGRKHGKTLKVNALDFRTITKFHL